MRQILKIALRVGARLLSLRGFYFHVVRRIHVYWKCVGYEMFLMTWPNMTHLQETGMWHILNGIQNLKLKLKVNMFVSLPLMRQGLNSVSCIRSQTWLLIKASDQLHILAVSSR
jgi:hypothetical protein